jgi:hypothetical protein
MITSLTRWQIKILIQGHYKLTDQHAQLIVSNAVGQTPSAMVWNVLMMPSQVIAVFSEVAESMEETQ